jgi:hypothetical protein
MKGEMTTRHLGIAAESNFSLQMWKWVTSTMQLLEACDQLKDIPATKIYEMGERAQK